jgi:hypothetical protein
MSYPVGLCFSSIFVLLYALLPFIASNPQVTRKEMLQFLPFVIALALVLPLLFL